MENENSVTPVKRKKTGGRQPGTPNKVSSDLRKSIQLFSETTIWRVYDLIDQIADGIPREDGTGWIVKPNPKDALALLINILEFNLPRLARVEMQGVEGGPPIVIQTLVDDIDKTGQILPLPVQRTIESIAVETVWPTPPPPDL